MPHPRTLPRPEPGSAEPGRADCNLSKITPPTLQKVHANARLFARLDAARACPVVWLHGPPGAGKTTLAASYLAHRGIRPLWYRLDGGDSDPASLFFYLAAAARQAPGAPALPLLTSEFRAALPLFTRRFFRDLFAIRGSKIVVFDDYHEIDAAAAVHDCLPHGLEEIPEGCHVVIVSRTPPPATFARLRLNGIVDVIEPDALRMTGAEAGGLARERGAEVSAARVEAIARQTQGWAAGVILMLEAGTAEIAAAPENAAVPELLFDYFAGEILQRMDAGTQRLLCTLALMPTMTAAAAERLTGSTEAGRLLEDLRKQNYFTSRDTAAEPRYRFHPLFHAFLMESARIRLRPDALATLRLEAAAILDADGQPDAAVALLAEAGAFERLAALIARRAPALMEEGRNDTLVGWLARLPPAVVDSNGWLSYWAGTARVHLAPVPALPHLRRAFELFEAADDPTGLYLAWAGQMEAIRIDAFGDFHRYDPLLDVLPKLMARHPVIPRGALLVAMTTAIALTRRRNDRAAIAFWQDRALREAGEAGRAGMREVMGYMFVIGDLQDARFAAARCTLDALPDPRSLDDHPLAKTSGLVAHAFAMVCRQEPGDVFAYIEEALVLVDATGFILWRSLFCGLAANYARQRDDIPAGRAWLQKMAEDADRVSPHRGSHYHMAAAHFRLSVGDLAIALSHADKAIDLSLGWNAYEAIGRLARAEILAESVAFDEAIAELERLDRLIATSATASSVFPSALLRADILFSLGNEMAGTATLASAMALGRQQDQRRIGLAPARGARLCKLALAQDIEPKFVRDLIRHSEIPAPDPYDEHWPWPIRITTLGGFAIVKNGVPMKFSGKTPKRLITLLKVIAAYGGRTVPEEKLIDAVWPDEDGDAARNALTIAIHRLRKLLGDSEAIVVSGGTVGLDPKRCWLDIWTIEHLIVPGAAAAAGTELPPRCERIFALYRGDFLPADEDIACTTPRREQLRRRFAKMVCARAAMRIGDVPAAIFERGLEVAPGAEELYQGLMQHHLADGEAGAGLAAYARLRQMSEETGVALSQASESLRLKLKTL